MFRKLLDSGEAGDNIGVLLRGVERTDVERGQVLCKPGSVTPHTKFEAQAYVLKKDERSEEHTSELQSRSDLVCRLLLDKKQPRRYLAAPY